MIAGTDMVDLRPTEEAIAALFAGEAKEGGLPFDELRLTKVGEGVCVELYNGGSPMWRTVIMLERDRDTVSLRGMFGDVPVKIVGAS